MAIDDIQFLDTERECFLLLSQLIHETDLDFQLFSQLKIDNICHFIIHELVIFLSQSGKDFAPDQETLYVVK